MLSRFPSNCYVHLSLQRSSSIGTGLVAVAGSRIGVLRLGGVTSLATMESRNNGISGRTLAVAFKVAFPVADDLVAFWCGALPETGISNPVCNGREACPHTSSGWVCEDNHSIESR